TARTCSAKSINMRAWCIRRSQERPVVFASSKSSRRARSRSNSFIPPNGSSTTSSAQELRRALQRGDAEGGESGFQQLPEGGIAHGSCAPPRNRRCHVVDRANARTCR